MYNWKRFWCPITGKLKFDYLGFLADPEDYGYLTNLDVVPFTDISPIPCLVLLGEAGIGKTTAAKQEYEQRLEQVRDSDDECLWFELGEYETDTRLCQEIFDNDIVQSWHKGSYKLYLFLDSLDEGLLSIKKLVKILKGKLKNLPCERLYIRITCRTADWLDNLEQKLKQKWGEESVRIYQLAPLRRSDVIEAAKQPNINSDEFIQEVIQREAVPLAIKPITLKFLLSIYQKNQQFPDSQKELYKQGCLELCQEVNEDRLDSGFTGRFNEEQRLIVAGRIAAVTILANRAAIWTSPDTKDMPDSDIAIKDLRGGQEIREQQKFDVDDACINEVLSVTGLFSGRGTNRIGFAHQTYAEFLAAWYLVERKIPLVQVMSLIVSSDDSEYKLVPQLHETAAWLASMRNDIFQEIVKTDPDVILRSDISTDPSKKVIIDRLLKQYDEEKLFPSFSNFIRDKKFKHPEMAEQLRAYIQDSSKQFYARNEAILIAQILEIYEVQEDLVNLARNSSQPIELRVTAAKTICSIGDADTKLKLKPLAVSELAEDENDELKGASLMAVWSEHLTAEELFRVITPPKTRNLFSCYQDFLESKLVPKLESTDLLIALNWVEKQGVRHFRHPFEELANSILLKAWDNFDSPGVKEIFAKIALIQWQESQPVITSSSYDKFLSLLSNEDGKRHKLIEQLVLLFAELEDDPLYLLSFAEETLWLEKEILWMLDTLQQSTSESTQKIWAKLIKWSFRNFLNSQDNFKYVLEIDAILTETETNKILRKELIYYVESINLDSVDANIMKAEYLEDKKWKNRKKKPPSVEPSLKERILLLLKQLESGNMDAWWRLNLEVTLQAYGYEFESDLTKLPGWQEADSDSRIIEGANKYIHEQNEVAYDWIGASNYDPAAFAGCRALQLLLKESPDCLDTLSSEIWQKWTPVIIAFSASNQNYLELVKLSYSNAPDKAIDTLFLLIDNEREGHNYLYITKKFEKCWDERLKSAFFQKAKDQALNPKWMGRLLDELLHHDFNEAREFAKSLITFPLPSHPEERERTIVAAIVLLENAEPNSWSMVWSVIQQDPNFGREIFELETYSSSHGINLNMTEEQMADLYIWLVQQYPENENYKPQSDSGEKGMNTPTYVVDNGQTLTEFLDQYRVNNRQRIVGFRNRILTQLKEKGTHQACAAIQRIVQAFPEETELKWTLREAQNIRRRKTWTPPKPDQILQLFSDSEKRLVKDGNELLAVLIESLESLQKKLHDQNPAVIDLWNEIKLTQVRSLADSLVKKLNLDKIDVWGKEDWRRVKDSTYIPKDENRFSDYVARYLDCLKSKGVIVNREVEIRRGERTDIQVDAVIKNRNGEVDDSITVIIEAKGCWNKKELDTAMEEQLVNRYLKDNRCQHGLYLIAWFNCEQWDDSDPRKRQAPKISIEEAKEKFEQQAAQLSNSGVTVKAFVLNTALR